MTWLVRNRTTLERVGSDEQSAFKNEEERLLSKGRLNEGVRSEMVQSVIALNFLGT